MDPRCEKHPIGLTLQRKIQQSVLNRLGRCYKRSMTLRAQILCHKCFCRNDLEPHSAVRSVFELRSAQRLLSTGQSVFSIAPQRQSLSLLARGVSDGDFWRDGSLAPGHPAKPMWNWHVRDPDFFCAVGFLVLRALLHTLYLPPGPRRMLEDRAGRADLVACAAGAGSVDPWISDGVS
jgi:hypothetical protein